MFPCLFEESDYLFAFYAWEALEEILDGIARLQVIEKTFHRDASSSKNWLPAKNFRILRYDSAHITEIIALKWLQQNPISPRLRLSTLNNPPSTAAVLS